VTRARALGLVCLALVAASAALWGASQAVWYRVTAELPGRAQQVVEVTGAVANGALGGVALLALAGVAGVVATGGVPRRVVGVLLAAAGLAVGAAAVVAFAVDPFATDGAVPRPPDVDADLLRYRPVATTPAPLLALLGAALLLVAGLAAALAERRLPRFGARYAAPGARPVPTDPDRAAWRDLDAGRDPTDP
jgi:hypothetical protein